MFAVIFAAKDQNYNLSTELNILGQSILDRQINWLSSQKIIDSIIVVGQNTAIRQTDRNINIQLIETTEQNYNVASIVRLLRDEPFFVILDNVVTNLKLIDIVKAKKATRAEITFTYSDKEENSQYAVKLDKYTRLRDLRLNEGKYKTYLTNIFLLNPELLTYVPAKNYHFISQFIADLLKRNKFMHGYKPGGFLKLVNSPEQYYKANFEILEKEYFEISGSKINNIYYGEKSEIDFSTILDGKQFIGNNCQLGAGGKLTSNIILDDIKLGKNCLLQNNILCNNVKIGDNCELDGCIIGENVILESNTKLAKQSILTKDSRVNKFSGVLNV